MLDIFEILGPIMVGPSSSHTAGAVRIGRMARTLLGERPVRADIGLYGSFAETGRGHGTDRALVAGLLGMKPDDLRIPNSFAAAGEQGLEFTIHPVELREAHPNTAVLTVEGASGRKTCVQAASTGGAGTGSGSSGGGSASQSSGDGDSDTSSGGTEASPERKSTEGTVPVAGGVGESSSPGGGEGDASPEGSASGGLVFQNGETSRLPALLVLVAFILFCFLSGPLAKMLAKRFPQKEEPTGK